MIVEVSAALELLHAFALLQDDVLDNSPLRRGATTVHVRCAEEHRLHGWRGEARRYGEGVAVLAGDLAFAYADRLMSGLPPRAREVWDELRTELIVGQYLDIAAAAEFLVDPGLCRWIALCKSGRYTIYRPLALGAAIAGRHDLIPVLAAYGLALGEAFQLRDDLIGAFGDSKLTGKPAGLDFDQQKMTLLLALAVRRDERVRRLVAAGGEGSWDAAALRPLLIEIGVRDEVERSIAQLVERASAAIAEAAIDRRWREELASMALQVAYRDR
jgi:geranylgeranyl diphosphate synthase type I